MDRSIREKVYSHRYLWDGITHPRPKFNAGLTKLRAWMSNYMPFLEWEVISYACPKHRHIYVSAQWGTGTVLWTNGDLLSIGTSGTTCTNIVIPQNILNNAACKMFTILFRPQQLVKCLHQIQGIASVFGIWEVPARVSRTVAAIARSF